MKKILIIITKGESGGAQTSVFNLAKKVSEAGFYVTVGYGEGKFLDAILNKYNIEAKKFIHLRRTHNFLKNINFIFELRSYLKKNKFDVIHFNSTNTLFGVLSLKGIKNKPKTIFTFRGLSILDKNYKKNSLIKLLYKLIFRFLLKFIDNQVFVSFENQKQARSLKITRNDYVIHNGLDPKIMDFYSKKEAANELEEKYNLDLKDKFILGSVGRLSYQKNYTFLIEQINDIKKTIPNACFLLIGSGPEEKIYKKNIQKLNLENDIFLLGDIPEAHRYLKAFDIFVLPSCYEGLSIVLIETLFAGIPVVCSDINGNRETLDKVGLFYNLNDKEDFLQKIKQQYETNIKKEINNNILKTAEKFNIEKTAKEYIKLYEN